MWGVMFIVALQPRAPACCLQNRGYFGLWALMKAPLLLSANLPALNKTNPSIVAVVSSPGVVAINQDPLGVQARKLSIDGAVLPWLVGAESCDAVVGGGHAGMRNRGWSVPSDTRVWSMVRARRQTRVEYGACEATGANAPGRPARAAIGPCRSLQAFPTHHSSSTRQLGAACRTALLWALRQLCCSRATLAIRSR